jgi:hypothetical protein
LRSPTPGIALCLALLLFAFPARAAGLNLAWDKCYSEGGARAKTFNCASNSGYADIIGSFIPAQSHPRFNCIDMKLDVQSQSQELPAWWQIFNSGSCRESAYEMSVEFRDQPRTSCEDPFEGTVLGLVGCYATPDHPLSIFDGGPNNARMVMGAAMANARNLSPGAEYYAFRLRILFESSTGGGACGGCATPVCLTLSELSVYDETPELPGGGMGTEPPPEIITQQAQNQMISWQDTGGNCQSKVRNKTWGQLKSLYR